MNKKKVIIGSYECLQLSDRVCEVKINTPIVSGMMPLKVRLALKAMRIDPALLFQVTKVQEIPETLFYGLNEQTAALMKAAIEDNKASGMILGSYWMKKATLIPKTGEEKGLDLEVIYEARIIN